MVTRFGMDEGLGHATYEAERQSFLGVPRIVEGRILSEKTARAIDAAVRAIVNGAFQSAYGVLGQHRAVLEKAARLLLEPETLDQTALARLRAALPLAAARG
jgi:cell division protease FtsH